MPHIPDGRTVLTEPEAHNGCNGPVRGERRHLVPFIPDTNAIEALNRQLRKAIKTKGSFPTEDAARKLVYLATQNATPQWTRTRNWTTALLAFKIHFGDRVPDTAG
jgi:transposase-like protein